MYNKSLFKNLKKKIISFCIAFGLFASAFTGLIVNNSSNQVYAYQNDGLASTFFSDPNFTQGGTDPTYWKLIEGEGNFNSERMVAGIFDSENTTDSYLAKYKVFENPSVPTDEDLASNDNLYSSLSLSAPYPAGGNFGYRPSSSKLDLAKDSYYVISITLKTTYMADTTSTHIYEENNSYATSIDSKASLYITGFKNEDAENTAKFEMIESSFAEGKNGWGTFRFFIATNQLQAEEDLDFEVWLGSKSQVSTGNVFFNKIVVEQLDKNSFDLSAKDTYSSVIVDLRDTIDTTPITNANFADENLYLGWETVSQNGEVATIAPVSADTFKGSTYYNQYNLTASDAPSTNMRSNDKKVLFMASSEADFTALKSVDEFEFERQKYYKVSVWAWSNSSTVSATAALINTTEDVELANASLTIATSSTTTDATNGWKEYCFFVYGHKFFNTTAKLQLAIGSEESGSQGYVFFDNVTIQEINYSQYSSNNSNTNCTTFNYNAAADDYSISNYSFDITENTEVSNKYPLTPAAWTYAVDAPADKSTISGVVNTHATLFNAEDLSIEGSTVAANPGKLPYQENDAYNNVLVMGSRYNSTQSYKSSSFTLNANSYNKISVYVNAPNGSAKIKIYNTNGVIFEKSNITSANWTNFTTYIKTGASEENVVIELALENNTSAVKYAFFDEVVMVDSTEAIYNDVVANENANNIYSGTFVSKVDLKNYTFDTDSTTDSVANGFEVGGTASGECFVKVQNTQEEYGYVANSGNNALVVYCGDDVNGAYYFAQTKKSYTLATGYHKVSVFVKTLNLQNGTATIAITGDNLNLSFTGINTEYANTNAWTEYSFYINATADTTVTLQLGLGSSSEKASGYALFDDITFTTLTVADEAEWETLTSSLDANVNKFTTAEAASTESEEDTNEETEDELFEGDVNWFFLVPSLITALAIIIAIVGTMLRKVDFTRKTKVKTAYDRRKTLDVSLDRKERIAKRQEEIKLLEQQLKEIEEEIAAINREVEVEKQDFANKHSDAKYIIEERRNAIIKEKENALHERNEKISKDKNAFTREEEEKFAEYIKKLEKQEAKETQLLQKHEKTINNFKTTKSALLAKTLARKEFIKAEIARIDAEIEEIAREEAQMWEEYKLAKADAKKRKAEYKSEQKAKKAAEKSKATEETTEAEAAEVKEETKVEESVNEVTETEATTEETTETVVAEESVEIITPDEEKSE